MASTAAAPALHSEPGVPQTRLRGLLLLHLLHVSHAAGIAERFGPVRTGAPHRSDLQQMHSMLSEICYKDHRL